MPPHPIFTFWAGGPLGRIERLALTSFVATGHVAALYSYDEVADVPAGVEIRDAGTVLSRQRAEAHRYRNGSWALAANLFRLEALRRGLGLWLDCDVVCIRRIDITAPFIAGWESRDYLNNAVLYADPGSAFLADALRAFENGRVPAWTPLRRAPLAYLRQTLGLPVHPADLPRGTFGPKAVTALARRHGLAAQAQAQSVFYPVAPRDALRVVDPDFPLEAVIGADTLSIHLWNEKLRGVRDAMPPGGSLLRQLYDRFGV